LSKFDHSHWIAMSPLTLVDDRPPVMLPIMSLHFSCNSCGFNRWYRARLPYR